MIFTRRHREEPRIDLTPLVDVVFLLLIFFMISTTFVESPGLDIRLPESNSQRQDDPVPELRVEISRSGQLRVDQQVMDLTQLTRYLQRQKTTDPATRFVVLADRSAEHGRVVEVMDLARQAGYRSLAIATQAKPLQPQKENP